MEARRQKIDAYGVLEGNSRIRHQKINARIVAHVQNHGQDAQLLESIIVTLAEDVASA